MCGKLSLKIHKVLAAVFPLWALLSVILKWLVALRVEAAKAVSMAVVPARLADFVSCSLNLTSLPVLLLRAGGMIPQI